MNVEKRGFTIPFSFEKVVGERRPGRMVPYTMTKDERAEYKRAKELLKEIERNPWIGYSWDEGHYLLPRKTTEWVYDD